MRKLYLSIFYKINKIYVYDLIKYNNEVIDLEKIIFNGKFEFVICILVIYVYYIVLIVIFDFFYLIWVGIIFIYKNV